MSLDPFYLEGWKTITVDDKEMDWLAHSREELAFRNASNWAMVDIMGNKSTGCLGLATAADSNKQWDQVKAT